MRLSSQQILVESPGLHDGREVPSLMLQQVEVGYRIAVHEKKIGDGAGLDDPEASRHPDDLGADDRCRADDLERSQHLGAQQEFPRLLFLQLPQQIAAEANLDARLATDLQ